MDALADYLLSLLPDTLDLLVVFPLSAVFVLLAGVLAAHSKARFGRTGYSRKVFHFTVFTTAFAIGVAMPLHRVAAFGAGAGLALLVIVYLKVPLAPVYNALARESDKPHRDYYLIAPFVATAAGGIITALIFPGYYQVGYLAAGWGDAAGEPVGTAFGRHRFRVPTLSRAVAVRSMEGTAGVFLSSWLASFVGLTATMTIPPMAAVGAALAAALLLTAVETVSPHGWDNLTTQIAACLGIYIWLLL